MAGRRSGLQQQVINFYRECFREARKKPAVNAYNMSIETMAKVNLYTLWTLFRKHDPGFMHTFDASFEHMTFAKTTLLL